MQRFSGSMEGVGLDKVLDALGSKKAYTCGGDCGESGEDGQVALPVGGLECSLGLVGGLGG